VLQHPKLLEKSEIFRLSEILRRRSEIFITYLYKNALSFAKMFYFTNYEVLIAISNIMKGVINDEKIDMISKFYNLDAQMLLSEANIFTALHAMQTRSSYENSVCPSVNTCMVTKRKKDLSIRKII